MIISLNWLKKFVTISESPSDLAKIIGAKLVEVEGVIDLGVKYQGVIVARVKSAERLEGSDHLSLCKIDDAGVNKQVERDENGWVQVVCGAPNVRANTNIAWIMPGAVVPETHGTGEEFVLGSRKLMGQMSNGMIASARELGLWAEHKGILILDESLTPGVSFAESYELNDFLFDIENKSLTQRPDCFGIIGFAREVATILGREFRSPDWFLAKANLAPSSLLKVKLDSRVSDGYSVALVKDVSNLPELSLLEKTYLARSGVRPISPLVDLTNFLMMLTAQPLHSFDYDKLLSVAGLSEGEVLEIGPRLARAGEKIVLLDGRELELSENDIVISAGEQAVALAGAMGAKNSDIDENTQRVLLESATFDLYKLRATQMRHGLFSEALTRFTKGQPASLALPVLAKAIEQIGAPAEVAQVLNTEANPEIEFDVAWVNQVLGTDLSAQDMATSLKNAEFSLRSEGDKLFVQAPFWRNDVKTAIEVVEEIGRVYGYDNISATLPLRASVAVEPFADDQKIKQIRDYLTQAGANEVLTYGFVSQNLLEKAGQDPKNSYRLVNSISPELQLCRQSLQASLLDLVHANIKAGHDEFALFEINRVHPKSAGLVEGEKVPEERQHLVLTLAKKKSEDTAFFLAKKYLEFLLEKMTGGSFELNYTPLSEQNDAESAWMATMFEPKRSAWISSAERGFIGVIGEYKAQVARAFKLPKFSAGFELCLPSFLKLTSHLSQQNRTQRDLSLPKFPGTTRDICLEVDDDNLNYAYLHKLLKQLVSEKSEKFDCKISLKALDIFRTETGQKRTTFELKLSSPEKTLTAEEANQIVAEITQQITTQNPQIKLI